MRKGAWELIKERIKRRGFTLVEVLIVVFVMAVGIITIMQTVTRTTSYISETAQRTVALNLAKEWIEAMYNIRNTNRRRRSSQRDQCWLKADPMVDEAQPGCEDDPWMREWWYVVSLKTIPNTENRYYHALPRETYDTLVSNNHLPSQKTWDMKYGWRDSGIFRVVDWDMPHDDIGEKSGMLIVKDGKALTASEILDQSITTGDLYQSSQWYWRNIHITGLYDKKNWAKLEHCPSGNRSHCETDEAKELRFCATVWSVKPHQVMVNICAVMTNFLK